MITEIWHTLDVSGSVPKKSVSSREFYLLIERNPSNWSNILQFIIPLLSAYTILGATMAIDPRKKVKERLTVYLSLFAFAPTFLFSTQQYLPFHLSLTIPEFLIANLIMSASIYGFFSLIINLFEKSDFSRLLDGFAISISTLIFFILYYFIYVQKFLYPAQSLPFVVSVVVLGFQFFIFVLPVIFWAKRILPKLAS